MNKESIGQIIERRRKSLKVSQGRLAEVAGVSIMTIVNIENGNGNPTLDVMLKVMDVLGLEFDIHATKGDRS